MKAAGEPVSESHPNDGTATKAAGRTMGDFFYEVLSSPKKSMTLILLATGLTALGLLGAWGLIELFHVQTSEIELGATDQHIIFKSVQKGVDEYLVVVNPEGWQNSGIEIKYGDHLNFIAGGKICIDMHHIIENTQRRMKLEDYYSTHPPYIREKDDSETRAPEDAFSPGEREGLELERPWTPPDGFKLEGKYAPRWRARKARYLFPDQGAGGLVAAIHKATSGEPDKSETFFVGSRRNLPADKESVGVETDGNLWFTVNDIQFSDPVVPGLFYNDNIGLFWVKVIVTHKK